MNLLEPLVDGVVRYIKWTYDVWSNNYNFSFNEFFNKVKLCNKEEQYPKQIKEFDGKLGRVFLFNIPMGLNEEDFIKHKKSIEAQIKEKVDIRYKNGYIEIEIITKKLPENIWYVLPTRTKESIYIPIGESLQGPTVIDLKEAPHSYIVGTTGSGKSVCTKGILTSIVNNYGPNEVELYLCDLKMVELSLFRNLAHIKNFVYTTEDTTEVIADLLEETKNRYNTFMDKGVTSIFEYNKIPGVKKMKYQILFIEEAVILLEDSKKKAMKLLKQLIAISRASGCYVFLTTQRPSSDIIDNVVKANINNRIVFAVEDEKNSNICLDSPEAKDLKGKGHGILKVGPTKMEFQSYFISDSQVKEYTKKYIVKNRPEEPKTENKTINDKLVNDNIRELKKANKEELTDLSFLDNL
ncbi:MAG: DNA translocase FtsK [Peptostreptococcaceae bacterium]|nr:DNA translocase FtsK [Peptostreptococcaceae bacterium]